MANTRGVSRRDLFRRAGLAGAALTIPVTPAQPAESTQTRPAAPPAAITREPVVNLTVEEADLLEAICARIIPTDENGPGAREARAAHYIDRALGGALKETRETYRAGLAAFDRYWADAVQTLQVGDDARVVARDLLHPRHVPAWVRAGMPLGRTLTAGLLPASVREGYGLHRPFVLFAGTVEPRKNLGRLVDAFTGLGDIDADLVIVGPEGWREDLTGADARVRRLGFVPAADRDALYAAATVVAYPSLREGFGLPVLEAMVQGAAVVTSATTSTAEVAGDAAVLVDPLDVDEIAAAMQRLLGDPELVERIGTAARERAATFTWARTADAMVAAYQDAVA